MGAKVGIFIECDGPLCASTNPPRRSFYNISLPVLMDPERAFSQVEEWKVQAARDGLWNYNPVTNRMLCNGCSEAEAGEQ